MYGNQNIINLPLIVPWGQHEQWLHPKANPIRSTSVQKKNYHYVPSATFRSEDLATYILVLQYYFYTSCKEYKPLVATYTNNNWGKNFVISSSHYISCPCSVVCLLSLHVDNLRMILFIWEKSEWLNFMVSTLLQEWLTIGHCVSVSLENLLERKCISKSLVKETKQV